MAEELKFSCSRGILLSRDPETGNLVPFFIKVRDQDIISLNNKSRSSLVVNEILDANPMIITSSYRSGERTVFTYRGFEVEADSNTNIIKARKHLNVASDFNFSNENNYTELVSEEFTLPVALKVNGDFRAEITIVGNNNTVKSSTASVNMTRNLIENDAYYTGGVVSLVNLYYGFDLNFKDIDDYKNSEIYITISGEL